MRDLPSKYTAKLILFSAYLLKSTKKKNQYNNDFNNDR